MRSFRSAAESHASAGMPVMRWRRCALTQPGVRLPESHMDTSGREKWCVSAKAWTTPACRRFTNRWSSRRAVI